MNTIRSFNGTLKHKDGFTLIEVLIAVAILAIAILALISTTVSVVKGNSFNKMMTTATTLAKDQMETLKNTPYVQIASSGGWQSVTGFPGYERQWQVTTINGNTSCTASGAPYACCTGSGTGTCPGRKSIDMDVRWQWQGTNHQVTLNTMIVQ